MAGSNLPEAPAIEVLEPWARPAYAGGSHGPRIGAAFMTIKNAGGRDDEIIAARCDEAAAARVHRTVHYGPEHGPEAVGSSAGGPAQTGDARTGLEGTGGSSGDVIIPAGESVELKPGGYHIALIGLNDDLVEGDQVTVTLTFREAGEQIVTVPVIGR